jgi:hypothetical protein
VLRDIDGTTPLPASGALDPDFSPRCLRLIYNVLKAADQKTAGFSAVFARSGYLCAHPDIATTFGFAALRAASCGY